ncbi:MAG: hypothetical protein PHX61_05355 [Alphaproteobacteria bacterium]|nr:hypothetical protein [Alphaproteobacteria bacterium]
MTEQAAQGFENFIDCLPYRLAHKHDYLRVAKKYLERKAIDPEGKRCILSDAYHICETTPPLDKIFGCAYWPIKKEKGNYISTPEAYCWQHRNKVFLEDALKRWHTDADFNRDELREGVAEYIRDPDLQDDWLDWYCADLLCFMELFSTIKDTRIQVHGQLAHMFQNVGGSQSHLIQMVIFIFKWAVWLFYLVWIFEKGDEVAYATVTVLMLGTIYVQYVKLSLWRKRSKIIEAMYRVYAVLQTPTFSWNVLWREMEDARKLGAIWDGEFWRLVEMRIKS